MYEGRLPIAARSAEMWFTTNTAFQPKEECALRKKNTSKGKKVQNRSMFSRTTSGKDPGDFSKWPWMRSWKNF